MIICSLRSYKYRIFLSILLLHVNLHLFRSSVAGVPADLDPPPRPNPLTDMDPPTKLSENIVLNVLVKMDDTLRSSAY